ncbi:MAG: Mur ligase family protein, partial [Patescibacteria group bacterium]
MAILKGFFSKLPKYLILEYGTDQPGDIEKLVGTLPPDMALLTIITEAHVANYGSMEKVAQDESRLVAAVKAEGTVIINKKDSYIGQYRTEIIAKKIVEVDTVPELIARNFASAAAKVLGINDEIIKQALSKPIAA